MNLNIFSYESQIIRDRFKNMGIHPISIYGFFIIVFYNFLRKISVSLRYEFNLILHYINSSVNTRLKKG